jgi:hypothetical protein
MSAIISDCGTYRYRLERNVGGLHGGKTIAFVMVNPSTADAEADDATIRKVKGFTARMGGSRVIVGNLFAYRATDISALKTAPDPVGPENNDHLRQILRDADTCVVAWGALSKLPRSLRLRWYGFANMAQSLGVRLSCLGVAKDGHPLHPCMIGYERPVLDWRHP